MNEQKTVIRIAVIFLVAMVLAVGLYFFYYYPETPKNTSLGTQLVKLDQFKAIAIDNNKEIKLGNKAITLAGEWVISEGVVGVGKTDFWCEGDSPDCIIYSISNGEYTAYISNMVIGKNMTEEIIVEKKPVEEYNSSANLRYYKATRIDGTGSLAYQPDNLQGANWPVIQIVGCIQDSICVSSGILSQDIIKGKEDYSNFVEFLNAIEVK